MHWKVLFACPNGIVRFQTVFFQKSLPTGNLDIQQGVAHTKQGEGHGCRNEVEWTEWDAAALLSAHIDNRSNSKCYYLFTEISSG